MKADQTYQKLFKSGFYRDLKIIFDAKINETLGVPVSLPRELHEKAALMRLIFEDGLLLSSIL